MFTKKRNHHLAVIAIALLLAVTLAACPDRTPIPTPESTMEPIVPPPPTAEPPATAVLTVEPPGGTAPPETPAAPPPDGEGLCRPSPDLSGAAKDALGRSRAASRWINNQLILTGPNWAVQKWVEDLGEDRIFAVELCDLSYLNPEQFAYLGEYQPPEAPGKSATEPHFSIEEQSQLVSNLYVLADERGLLDLVGEINSAGNERRVFADLNYLTGPLAISPCGDPSADPFEVGGSPFEVGGSPFEVGGSPAADPGMPADHDTFWRQWALVHAGARDVAGADIVESEGEGVTIAVFDTSPFAQEVGTITVEVPNAPISMRLNRFAYDVPALIAPPAATASSVADVSDHGLFASGLAYAVAQYSDLELIRVLNEYGCGDLQTLNKAIHEFIVRRLAERDNLDETVLNFSLGVHKPSEAGTDKPILPREIVSLEEAIRRAAGLGAVIVAASGNDSADYTAGKSVAGPLPMQLPADYDVVIGVAASTVNDDAACYSNQGDLSAPGGDGGTNDEQGTTCAPASHLCAADDANCPQGVISVFSDKTGRTVNYGLRFWVGTSFAAPLVSGQAALLLERDVPPIAVKDLISDTVRPGAALGAGVIDIANSVTAVP